MSESTRLPWMYIKSSTRDMLADIWIFDPSTLGSGHETLLEFAEG